MNILYVTWDKIGSESGAGKVTKNELLALQELGSVDVINPPITNSPFEADEIALTEYSSRKKDYQLAHFYAGSYPKLATKLSQSGTKITYTSAAHDIELSKTEHEKMGRAYNFPHLTDQKLFDYYMSCYKLANVMICPSSHSKSVLESQGCQNVEVIPHGCDIPSKIKVAKRPFVVGYLGSPLPDKGLVYLIQAWSLLNYKDSQLVMAGRYSETLLPLVRKYGKGSIHLAGWLNSPDELYEQCSVYCQASVSEGFGCEVIEAMSFGKPVICSLGTGAVDAVIDNVNGRVVPIRNPKAIADAIDDYKNNPEKLVHHGKAAIEQSKNYSWNRIRQKYLCLWKGFAA